MLTISPGTYVADPTDTSGLNNDIQGLAFVTFDNTSGVLNDATKRIFVGTADKTASVYVSNDAGSTWEPVAGQPTGFLPHKCKLSPKEKALYLTYSDTSGPYDGANGTVQRYDLTTSTWKDITPVSGSNLYFGFGGLGIDLQKPGTLIVASLNSYYPDLQLFRSNNSGATWSPIWQWAADYPDRDLYYSFNVSGMVSEKWQRNMANQISDQQSTMDQELDSPHRHQGARLDGRGP